MKIGRPHAIGNIEQLPGLDLVLQNLHNNLRSEIWNPPELSEWGDQTQGQFYGHYQLTGRVCHIVLHVAMDNVSLGSTDTYLTLPIKAFRGIPGANWYPLVVPGQIVLYDHTVPVKIGDCTVLYNDSNKLVIPSYSPASSHRKMTLSGYYWVE